MGQVGHDGGGSELTRSVTTNPSVTQNSGWVPSVLVGLASLLLFLRSTGTLATSVKGGPYALLTGVCRCGPPSSLAILGHGHGLTRTTCPSNLKMHRNQGQAKHQWRARNPPTTAAAQLRRLFPRTGARSSGAVEARFPPAHAVRTADLPALDAAPGVERPCPSCDGDLTVSPLDPALGLATC